MWAVGQLLHAPSAPTPSRRYLRKYMQQPQSNNMTVQRQAQADRDACDRLLKAIFDRGFGQRQ